MFVFLAQWAVAKHHNENINRRLLPATSGTSTLFGQAADASWTLRTRKRVGFMTQLISLYGETDRSAKSTIARANCFHIQKKTH